MDWLSFASSVIGSLVWPVAIVMLVPILNRPIQQLLKLLSEIRQLKTSVFGGSIEAEFS